MTRIYAYGARVCCAETEKGAHDALGLRSYIGLYDITESLKLVAEKELGPWPHDGGMLVHLTEEDMAAIKATEEDQRDAEWWRVEAQGLAERLNAAVLAKIGLDEELAGLRLDHNNLTMASIACQQALDKAEVDLLAGAMAVSGKAHDFEQRVVKLDNLIAIQRESGEDSYMVGMLNGLLLAKSVFDDVSPEFKKARPDVGVLGKTLEQLEAELQEIQKRALTDEDEKAAQLLEEAQAFCLKHPMDPDEVAPSVSDTSPNGLGADTSPAIAGEDEGLSLSGLPVVMDPKMPSGYAAFVSAADGSVAFVTPECVSPPPAVLERPSEEAPMSFEAPTDSLGAARDIMRREWPAGTPTLDIITLMQKHVPGGPAWATNKVRLGIEAARLGLKRPAGFRATLAKAATGPVVAVTPVPEMASRVRKAEPPKATVVAGPAGGSMAAAAPVPNARIMGVGQLPPAPPKTEPVKAPALAISAQSAITKSYGPFVEKLMAKGLGYDDIKRRMNKELPRNFTRDDVRLIAEEMGL